MQNTIIRDVTHLPAIMSHSIFDALPGVTLEGSSSMTVQQFLETPDLIQNTITIGGGPPTTTSTPPSQQCSQINTIISEGVTLDEDDLFQCGRCKKQFSSLDLFMVHKRHQCSGKNSGLRTIQAMQDPTTSTAEQATFEEDSTALTSQIHMQVQPQQVPVSGSYSGSGLPSPGAINQHIIVNEGDLLPFTIETTQVLPLPGGLQTASFLPVSSGAKTLTSTVSPLLTTTANITTPLDVGSTLSSPQPLGSMVGGVTDGSEGGGGESAEGAATHTELTGEEKDIACYNHEFFHGGMAKTISSKNESTKLKGDPPVDHVEEVVMKEEVLVDDSYKCQYCEDYSVQSYVKLRTHMKTHANQKVYKCIQKNCELSFPDQDSFLEHIHTHNEDQDLQYRCHFCSKVFNALDKLSHHQHEQHSTYPQAKKTVGPSYFRCTKCMNKYASAEALEHHLRTSSHHYPCRQCGKVFTSERLLRRHLHSHGTVNLFPCSVNKLRVHMMTHVGGRGKRGRGRGRGSSSASRGERTIKVEVIPQEDARCSSCDQVIVDGEDIHQCIVVKSEPNRESGGEDGEENNMIGSAGRARPLRQAVVRRTREQSSMRRGSRRKRGGLTNYSRQPEQQAESPPAQQQQQDEQQEEGQEHIVKVSLSPSHEVEVQEHHLLDLPVGETDMEGDTQNVEIIYIPFSLPLSRPFQAEIMRAMSNDDEAATISGEMLEGGPTITLDGTTSSLLVGNGTMMPMVTPDSVDSLDTTILKSSSDLQVIYSPATVQQAADTTTHLVDAATLAANHLHHEQLGQEAALEESQLASNHLTHLSIISNQT
ncbi:Zinc finger protein 341 [Portunus trituberculatus]|uniref:Zinc finger protein 341 n=1 Tax=Portunus trituberculatus TaxID=210409 RepID=A0A5B7E5U1_PORTR|nr:Zinc finger protein 341 [Portunus trituberculatus]